MIDRAMSDIEEAPGRSVGARLLLPGDGFLERFLIHLEEDPLRTACHSVTPEGDRLEAEPCTFRVLAERAGRARRGLEAHGLRRGDRVLLCVGRPDRMLVGLLACWAGGLVPVPLPTAGEFHVPAAFLDRIASVEADCGPSLIVMENRARWEQAAGGRHAGPPVVDPDALESQGPHGEGLPPHPAGGIAFLQYTSGSTGCPRGVVVTHDNLAANLGAIQSRTEVADGDRMVSWLPLHHDMGLVGSLLLPVYARFPTYVLPPVSFITRPASWLRALSEFGGTLSVAPNFAYALCVRRVAERDLRGVDLSCWRLAFNGAEPIDAEMVRAFIGKYQAYGFRASSFYPVYGLAESTLAVAFPTPGTPPVVDTVRRSDLSSRGLARPADEVSTDAVTFVSVGSALPGHRIEVQDPVTQAPLRERQVGEVVAYGPSVSPRYFGDPEGGARDRLRTGDLGYVAEGRLYVIDRLKDLVIVAGQNFSPSDIERTAGRTPGVRKGRIVAFSTPGGNGTEQLHIVAELDPRTLRGQASIGADMSRHVREDFGLSVREVRLVEPGALPRTTSGKIQRRACRALCLEGRLPASPGMARRVRIWLRWQLRRLAAVVPSV